MTKADIVNLLCDKVGLPQKESQEIVKAVFGALTQAVMVGEAVKVSGFGAFTVRKKAARVGRNPKTKQAFEIAPRRVVTFKASDLLKGAIQSQQADRKDFPGA